MRKNTVRIRHISDQMTKEELDKKMAYLEEKIKKASVTWKGVDVDVYMDEVRCRESDDNS